MTKKETIIVLFSITLCWSSSYIFIKDLSSSFSAYAYVMLMYSEKYCDAITVTVIAATDPVITLILAILIPSTMGNTELFSTRSFLGAIIIAVGAVVAGTNFLSPKKDSAGNPKEALPDAVKDDKSAVNASAAIDSADASAAVNSADASVAVNSADASVAVDSAEAAAAIAAPFSASASDDELSETGSDIAAAAAADTSGQTPNRLVLLRIFAALTIGFAMLGMSINVMKYADGFTEIRPENFIPVTAGILFGPVAALACGIGNFLQDRMFDFGYTSILGRHLWMASFIILVLCCLIPIPSSKE